MKKGSLYETWPEMFFILFLVIGLLVSYLIKVEWIAFLVLFLSGLIIGRLGYMHRHKPTFILYFVVFAYLLGFFVGNYFGVRANYAILILVLAAGITISYKIHIEGHVR